MDSGPSPLTKLVTPEEAGRLANESDVLALVRFGGKRDAGDGRSPWIDTGLTVLGPVHTPVQCWRIDAPVRHFRDGQFTVHAAPGLAMLATTLPADGDPAPRAEAAYRELFATAKRLDCPHFLRIWQYLPRINEPFDDEDRYKRFSSGRRQAFEAAGISDTTLPAACLLGDATDSILIYALVADSSGTQVENPRQVSAFHYPPQYGRASPSFSRALVKRWPDGSAQLYISGTASVVGHASLHTTIEAQLGETLTNLEALLAEGRRHGGPDAEELAAINPLKVYIRHASDYPRVRELLAERLPAGHPLVYLHADVCRPDLLVEIEGVAAATVSP